MSKNFVVRKDAAFARFVPRRVVEPNFRQEVRSGFPRSVRALINAQICLDEIRSPMNPPHDDYIYGYNAGKRLRAQEYAAEAHLEALRAGDWDSANRIRKKFELTAAQLEAHVDALSDKEWEVLREKGREAKIEGKLLFIQDELAQPPQEAATVVDELMRMGHISLEEGANKLEVFAAYCTKLLNNILDPKSA